MAPDTTVIRPARAVDLPAIVVLLEESGLPLEGLGAAKLWVVEGPDGILGVGGLEVHGSTGLMRSLAVPATRRGSGVGSRLVAHVLTEAKVRGLDAVYTLTTTATAYLQGLGFEVRERATAPAELGASAELQGACPSDAALLVHLLEG